MKKKIKMFIMDVDGTLTDGKIYIGSEGEEFKAFDVKDGYGIAILLPNNGIIPVIITGRCSQIVKRRADELGISELYQNVSDKLIQLKNIARKYNIESDEIAYMGDDLNDLDCIEYCGFTACPFDAVDEVKKCSDYICQKKSGYGAVREVIDLITNQ